MRQILTFFPSMFKVKSYSLLCFIVSNHLISVYKPFFKTHYLIAKGKMPYTIIETLIFPAVIKMTEKNRLKHNTFLSQLRMSEIS